jgi:hypothetical protein
VESAFPAGRSRGVTVAVEGAGAGLCLLAFGLATLLAGGHARGGPARQASADGRHLRR